MFIVCASRLTRSYCLLKLKDVHPAFHESQQNTANYTKDHVCTAYKYPRKEGTEPKPVQTRNRRADRLHPTMRIDAPASTLAALASLVRLRVHARRHEDVVARGRLDRVRGLLERLAGYDAVDV